jgi:hypothetical protein
MAAYLNDDLTFYAAHTRGLEETGIAHPIRTKLYLPASQSKSTPGDA